VARKLPHEAWVQVQRSEFHLFTASVNGHERERRRPPKRAPYPSGPAPSARRPD